jgi:hypothetical protein
MWNARIEAIREGGIGSIADALLERWFSTEFRRTRSMQDRAGNGCDAFVVEPCTTAAEVCGWTSAFITATEIL